MVVCALLVVAVAVVGRAAEPLGPIQKVEIGSNRELRVNGEAFFPLMSWLQEPKRYPKLRSLNFNTFCGNHGVGAKAMLDAAKAAGGYAIPHFDANAAGHESLLAWIHGDEPDLPRTVSDAKVTPGKGLILNKSTPLWRIVDGVTHSWSVLDPLAGAEVTIELPRPVTVGGLAVWLTISQGLSAAKDVVFLGDGKELAQATLAAKKGAQKIDLPQPATFRRLTFRVASIHADKNAWGSVSEIEGFDAAGRNVLLSPPRTVPRTTPEQLAAEFRALKQADASRPVFVTFTAYFMSEFSKYDEATRKRLYPGLVASCDVVGFDVYPIYGWNKPEWLPRVAAGVTQLRAIAGEKRPLYGWIETSKGSQWISYAQQKDVLPAHTRAEVWMAIIRGATAIGYFTHAWRPTFTEFRPTDEMQAELKRLNGQITRLAPAILAPQARQKMHMDLGKSIACHLKATSHDGAVYLFAQSIELAGAAKKASFVVEGLRAGTRIEVVDEGRGLTAAGGGFSDDFAPLQEHIYRFGAE
jgi:hypothetical protein